MSCKNGKNVESKAVTTLIKKAQGGCQESFEKLLFMYELQILAIANKFYLQDGDLEDLHQEAKIAFHQAVMSYKFDEKYPELQSYMYICITRRIYTRIRKSRSLKNRMLTNAINVIITDENIELRMHPDYLAESPEETYMKNETYNEYVSILEEMCTQRAKDIFELRVQGYDYKTIAEKLNITKKDVDNSIQKSRKMLKKHLKDEE